MQPINSIAVIGLGYIGLPTAAVFADRGIEVIGVDVLSHVVDKVRRGEPHFGEPNLDALMRRVVEAGKLRAATQPEPADAFLIAVPTPFKEGHRPDLSYVDAAARSIAPVLAKGNLVILESTSPVGATEMVAGILAELRPDLSFPQQKGELSDIRVAHCPERVLPGRILEEVVNNDRIIGGMTRRCGQQAKALYKIVVKGECFVTIAFANEMAVICENHGINPWEMIRMANRHPRVNILNPGPGVGGHCIAVDPWFIVDGAPDEAKLIRTARERNDAMPHHVAAKIERRARELRNPVIACLGLAYKANVDDLRESPAIEVVKLLAERQVGEVLVVEPHIGALPASLSQLGLALTDFDVAVERANLVVLLVDHQAFSYVDRDRLKDKFVIDTRGAW